MLASQLNSHHSQKTDFQKSVKCLIGENRQTNLCRHGNMPLAWYIAQNNQIGLGIQKLVLHP